MSLVNQNIIAGAAGQQGYQISRSVRLRSSASAYFNRTLTTPTNNLKWTWSAWVKRGTLATSNPLFYGGDGSSNNFAGITFRADDTLQFAQINGGAYNVQVYTTAVFRDPSAWYHVVVVYDSANATSTDRVQLYVNGTRYTSLTYSTGPFAQNTSSKINSALGHYLGKIDYAAVYPDCYVTENNFIDGQALTPSSFGETDAVTGVWKPKRYTGTYGTNGFYLNFSDNSAATAAAIGKDSSGNGNNWTPNNISVTAGVTYDSMLDTPTPYADGGNSRGNYAVLNPIMQSISAAPTNGNLTFYTTASAVNWYPALSTIMPTMSFYAEFQPSAINAVWVHAFGISPVVDLTGTTIMGNSAGGFCIDQEYNAGGATYARYNGSIVNTFAGTNWSTSDVFMLAFDYSTGRVYAGRNGTWYNSGNPAAGTGFLATLSTAAPLYVGVQTAGSNGWHVNFGQRPFAYTPPTGFKALNTQNLPDSTIKKGNQYFDAALLTGNGSTQSVTSLNFQPDLVWSKSRVAANSHKLYDSVRGAMKALYSNGTAAEANDSPYGVTAFNSNGFTVSDDANGNYGVNGGSGGTYSGTPPNYVDWCWKKGATQGFDIVTYTGDGASSKSISHSLGVAPKMIIVKNRSSAVNWEVYHASLGAGSYIYLNSTNAAMTAGASTVWNAAPTSSVFTVGSSGDVNGSGASLVAYLFAEVAGFSKFGSYTGNGSTNGPFVYCGFRPRFILIKCSSAAQSWHMIDTARDTYNLAGQGLEANTSGAEYTPASSGFPMDILSNGFKLRNATEPNNSGATYTFAAFAENPFKNSLAR